MAIAADQSLGERENRDARNRPVCHCRFLPG
jgi:hypothetical protein